MSEVVESLEVGGFSSRCSDKRCVVDRIHEWFWLGNGMVHNIQECRGWRSLPEEG